MILKHLTRHHIGAPSGRASLFLAALSHHPRREVDTARPFDQTASSHRASLFYLITIALVVAFNVVVMASAVADPFHALPGFSASDETQTWNTAKRHPFDRPDIKVERLALPAVSPASTPFLSSPCMQTYQSGATVACKRLLQLNPSQNKSVRSIQSSRQRSIEHDVSRQANRSPHVSGACCAKVKARDLCNAMFSLSRGRKHRTSIR